MSKERDEETLVKLAYALLGGIDARDKKGRPQQRYFKAKSREEKAARHALASLLASDKPLDGLIRRLLAGLFDPAFHHAAYPNNGETKFAAERELRFASPSRRSIEDIRRLQLGFEFWVEIGSPKPEQEIPRGAKSRAIITLIDRYGVDEKTVRNAYDYAIKAKWAG